ncbi:MAG: 5,10-methylenetetrahydromethanopterin reductase [Thermomicrobiales bacterium]|nr:5,10-methylenetetrahydromethanopterin reductase [Thermomicrobiales bacterium]
MSTTRQSPRLGLLLPLGPTPAAREIADRAKEAEAAGFDSAWVIEDYYSWECFASLGYLAAVTERITLGVSVTTPYVRPAALLASAAATLDQFAGGRFLLGMGRCTGALLGQIGVVDRLPLTTLQETTEALRLLWRGGTVSYHGKTVEIDRVVPDVLPVDGGVPILFGAIGPKALRLAGRIADGVILTSFAPVAYARWAVREVRAGAEEAGRDPAAIEVVAIVTTRVTEDVAAALHELKPWLGLAYGMTGRGELLLRDSGTDHAVLEPIRDVLRIDEIVAEGLEPYLHAYKRVGPEQVTAVVPSGLVDQAANVGDAASCRARLAEYVAAGVDHVIVDSPHPADELMRALRGS